MKRPTKILCRYCQNHWHKRAFPACYYCSTGTPAPKITNPLGTAAVMAHWQKKLAKLGLPANPPSDKSLIRKIKKQRARLVANGRAITSSVSGTAPATRRTRTDDMGSSQARGASPLPTAGDPSALHRAR